MEPDDPNSPTVWQGPICISLNQGKFDCVLDISLVKEVRCLKQNNALMIIINAFSGSNAFEHLIDPYSCQRLEQKPISGIDRRGKPACRSDFPSAS
jgi:hypothetical protein